MSTVLLLGASGFLGRHVRALLSTSVDLICPSHDECDLVRSDVAALTRKLRRYRADAVVNCAGRVTGTGTDLVEAHTVATGKLIEAMAGATPLARLIRLGSAAEYGPVPEPQAVRETDHAAPVSEYGISQLAATRLTEIAAADGRLDTVVLRVFNPVGPGLPETNVLGRAGMLLRTALRRGTEHVEMGLLPSHRDFVDVRDVALAVGYALRPADLTHRVINIASGRAVSIRDAIELLARTAGFDGEIRDGSYHPTAARSAAVPWMRADVSRAFDALGWTSTHDLGESLKLLWADDSRQPPRPKETAWHRRATEERA